MSLAQETDERQSAQQDDEDEDEDQMVADEDYLMLEGDDKEGDKKEEKKDGAPGKNWWDRDYSPEKVEDKLNTPRAPSRTTFYNQKHSN